jgi:hypothetical protein
MMRKAIVVTCRHSHLLGVSGGAANEFLQEERIFAESLNGTNQEVLKNQSTKAGVLREGEDGRECPKGKQYPFDFLNIFLDVRFLQNLSKRVCLVMVIIAVRTISVQILSQMHESGRLKKSRLLRK